MGRNLLICLLLATMGTLAGHALAKIVAPLSAAKERALKPKDTFQECSRCPVMMVVPAGSFIMGSPASEPGRYANEGPQHKVTIASQFAVSRFELIVEEWYACSCRLYAVAGLIGGRWPVTNVTWDDAQRYVAWLSEITGKPYRLLSEAEYEYATRAGTTTTYPWGDTIGTNNANCKGCGSKWDDTETAPVGSFAANGFGLYDMVGNVREWTQDCFHANYNDAPTDGSAWTSGGLASGGLCFRVFRGGSFYDDPDSLRSAGRAGYPSDRSAGLGFRIGRTLLTP